MTAPIMLGWYCRCESPDDSPDHLRFMNSVRLGSGFCWIWQAAITDKGYGTFGVAGKTRLAHRWSYEHFVGPIAPGLQIDHLCRVRSCVNPEHMEAVSARENQLRGEGFSGLNGRKTHCVHGHKFDEANTYYRHDVRGRMCRTCARDRQRARRARLGTT